MTLDEYQEQAMQYAKYPKELKILYTGLALNEEAGEYAGKIAKWIRKGGDLDYDAAAKELGDTLWQLSAAADAIGFTLNDIANINLFKLADREERGVIVGEGDTR